MVRMLEMTTENGIFMLVRYKCLLQDRQHNIIFICRYSLKVDL